MKLSAKKGEKNATRVQVYRNQEAIDERRQKIESILPNLQNLVNAYFSSPLDKSVSLHQIVHYLKNIEKKYFSDMLEASNPFPKESGLKLKIENIYLEKDADLMLYQDQALKALNFYALDLHPFILKDGQVSIDEDAFERFIDSKTLWADTPESIDLLLKLEDFADACTQLDELLRAKHNSFLLPIKEHLNPIPIARFFTIDQSGRIVPKHETFAALKANIDINAQIEASV